MRSPIASSGSISSVTGTLPVWLWNATQILCFSANGREPLGQRLVPLGRDRDAPQRLGDLEVELDLLVGLAEGELLAVDVHAGVVVHLPQLAALGELRLPLLGALGVGGRLGRRLLRRLLPRPTPRRPPPRRRRRHRRRRDPGVLPDRPVHQLRFAEPVLHQRRERLLGGVDTAAAIAVGDAADVDAVEDGIGLARGRGGAGIVREGPEHRRLPAEHRDGASGGHAAQKPAPVDLPGALVALRRHVGSSCGGREWV